MISPTGEQFVLDDGRVHVEIGALAAVLREARAGGVRITETVPADALPPMGCGIVLAPWPNRVRDAKWILDGVEQQLDITEVSRGSAIHGLLRNTAYQLRARTPLSLTLGATVYPQHGWPFILDTWVTYAIVTDGLSVTHGATNLGDTTAPWAVGAHPYFRVGETSADALTVRIAARTRLELDAQLSPISTRPVDDTEFDLRSARSLAGADFNVSLGALANHDLRRDVAWLEAPDGASTVVWADPMFRWLQLFTPADFPGPEGTHRAVALEPMTAPPDALNSGTDLCWLDPGESIEATWGVRYHPGEVA